jgi:glycosyltransferase involved in cell wall biosynthesis
MMKKTRHITLLVPCYNEEKGIGLVIDAVPKQQLKKLGYTIDILVIDNNSQDRTAKVARGKGARVITEKKQGKGNAMITGFRNVPRKTDYVVMMDGDYTYKPEEMPRLLELLDTHFCDVVIGSRLGGRMHYDSMSFFNRAGNWLFSFILRQFYFANITDVCSGYFAWKREVTDKLVHHLESAGFAIEMEMVTKMARLGYDIYSVPITYDKREGESHLRPFKDGSRIIFTAVKNFRWLPG